jgi:tetratricopeptide (TPR) repeat protein/tRNA A-37 threonylcarbamoyl transferase component Bud32
MANTLDRLKQTLVDRYTIEREIGRGGMATVYLAQDLKHHRSVAIKVVRPELAASLGVDRFLREIDITAKLNHPHILPLHDSGQADGLAFFVMPYVEGESLRQRLEREGQLPLEDAQAIARDVADGLAYAHRHGCVHRDVKPENILLTEDHAVLADFGVARAIKASAGENLTTSGIALGTPTYLSPEQAGGETRIDGRADIYALGCVVFEMLAGEPPFTGPTAQAIISKHILEPTPALGVVRPGIPEHVAVAVGRALRKSPADRFKTAADFADALATSEAGALAGISQPHAPARRPWASRWSRPLAALLALMVLGSVLAVLRWRLLEPGSLYAVEDPRQKFMVQPHQVGPMSAEEERVVRAAADELTRLLAAWDQARVVPTVSKAGLMFDLGLSDAVRSSLDESIALAREARVGTLVTLTVRLPRDSAYLEAQLYDVATEHPLGDPIATAEPADDIYALVAPVAARILDFSGAPSQLLSANRETTSLDAFQQVLEGRRDLERGRLESAERAFRAALQLDSTFARAHYLLALTVYWQAARDPQRSPELSGEIRRHASAARRHGGLVYRDSLFVEAFFSFQNGGYAAARELYRRLVRSDSTDAYAWLMLGTVEVQDPWAEAKPDGALLPRGNLNLARHAFSRAVQLSPDFFLGYGHLFDIYTHLTGAVLRNVCYGYEPPGDRVVLIWDTRDAKVQVNACPVLRDSIEWVDRPTLAAMDRGQLIAGADRFFDEARRELRRWSNYAPADPRPMEELTAWLLARRDLLPYSGSPAERDSLAAEALRYTEGALDLESDTLPEDLIRLGMLYLAADDVPNALRVTDQAVARSWPDSAGDSRLLPLAAANTFLATGQVSKALDIVLPVWSNRAMSVPDTAEGREVDVLIEAEVGRLQVYGATGLGGAPLNDVFARMERVWSQARYDERLKRVVRQGLSVWIPLAVTLEDSVMAAWFTGWEPDDPVFAGLLTVQSDTAVAHRLLEQGIEQLGPRGPSPTRAYLLGVLAQRLDRHEQAIELFGRIDTWPLMLGTMDVGWGLSSLSQLRRGRSYEALGDTTAARQYYERFIELWNGADPELQPLVVEAREAFGRVP